TLPPPQLRPARFEDYPQIERLESSHGLGSQPADDWRGLWINNPLWPRLRDTWQIGWVLEDAAGHLVGSLTNVPTLYKFRGRELICANGRGRVVAPEYRGFTLWLLEVYFDLASAVLLMITTLT